MSLSVHDVFSLLQIAGAIVAAWLTVRWLTDSFHHD